MVLDLFEYISVLSSIIVGLGIAHLLRGVIGIIHHPEEGKPYWIHLIWVSSTFLLAVVWWWFQFNLAEIERWTFGSYVFVLTYSVTIYLLCAVLFPAHLASFGNYKVFYYSKSPWYFSFFIVQRSVDIVDTFAKGGFDRFIGFGPEYWIGGPLQIILAGVAIFTRNEKFHAIFAIGVILLQVSIAFRLFPAMG